MENILDRVGGFIGFAKVVHAGTESGFNVDDIVRVYEDYVREDGAFIENSYRSPNSVYDPYEWKHLDQLEPVPFWKGLVYSLIMMV